MIRIAGGGLSGLSAAKTLAEAGKRVEVFEKNSEVGSRELEVKALRNYGEGDRNVLQMIRKDYGIDIRPDKEIYRVDKYTPSLHKTTVVSDHEPILYTVKCGSQKDSLHSQLLKSAERAGARIRYRSNLRDRDADIVATGPHRNDALVVGGVYDNVEADPYKVHMFYNNRYSPNGYICLLPHEKHEFTILSVAFFTDKTNSQLMDMLESAYTENEVLSQMMDSSNLVHPISGHFSFDIPRRKLTRNRIHVGEKGGFQDFSRAFGVKQALVSGYLGAKSIVDGHSFHDLISDHLFHDIKESFKNRIKFQKFQDFHIDEYYRNMGKHVFLNLYENKRKPRFKDEMEYPIRYLKWKALQRI
jgi:flavin-dependent dehydrogenase